MVLYIRLRSVLSHHVVDGGDGKVSTAVQQQSQDALSGARLGLICLLDSVRLLLEEILP